MPASPMRQIAGGFLCNAFNPKAPIYFLALFTVVLSPKLPLPTLLVYGGSAAAVVVSWSHAVRASPIAPAVACAMDDALGVRVSGDCARLSG